MNRVVLDVEQPIRDGFPEPVRTRLLRNHVPGTATTSVFSTFSID